jgi:hypothetical protein
MLKFRGQVAAIAVRRTIQCALSVRVITVVLVLILAQDKSHFPHFTFTSQLDDRALAFLTMNHAF